jgi:hypothetical protein
MVGAYAVEARRVLVLLIFTVTGSRVIWPVFVAMALFGACGKGHFGCPGGQAMTVNLVPKEMFASAVALNSTLFQTAAITGPGTRRRVLRLRRDGARLIRRAISSTRSSSHC